MWQRRLSTLDPLASTQKRRAPTRLSLFAVYLISFFLTSMWLMTLPQQHKHIRSRSNSVSPGRIKEASTMRRWKRPNPMVKPSDFFGLKLLAFGDTPYQFVGWDVAPIVVESHRLLFWTTPKVACTVFKKAFRRMEGYKNWLVENKFIPHHPNSNGLNYLYHYKPAEADRMLTDPTWTRALFVRDPKERLLSAYLDKVVANHSYYVRKRCCKIKSMEVLLQCDEFRSTTDSTASKLRNPAVSFSEFVNDVHQNCTDPHWKPQSERMPDKYWRFINFVGRLDSVQLDAQRLLQRIGAWEHYGASGWPSGAIFAENKATHATFAKNQMKTYFTPELERIVETIHRADYIHPLFNFSEAKYTAR